ncbi:uncharacterized protein B0H18DRAFT_1026441 [Fomitopsis serialis]|uniref:uncharacterized protein n=1 Tax=Fomitopsis serialis TaxID=139415 RepID=UPI0020075F9C|nr:uncharacterized protein B0H18DRAFT_1026441 [Neoantrodia serialis]KAH9919844.1 hypothetical protein B0H18DRAFT_1026441 [Neoantrodia serialis]
MDGLHSVEDAVTTLSQTLRARWTNCEPLLLKLEEINRLVQGLPPDEPTLQASTRRLDSVLADLEISDSLSSRFARLMQRWLPPAQRSEPDWAHESPVPPPANEHLSTGRIQAIAKQLQSVITALKAAYSYAPRDVEDVLQTERILHVDLGLPLPLVWTIFDEAEYWVRSVGRCGSLTVTAETAAIQESLCCTARIPPGVKDYRPLRRIVFTIESHDQGWRTSDDGGSWTWFEVGSDTASRRFIANNTAATRDFRTHRVQWDLIPNDEDPEADTELHEWMSRFAGGEDISVFARAQFGGWKNYVRRVLVEVYCACV